MLPHLLFFCLGLAALVVGAQLLVRGASKLALSLGISPLVVGLTVVAFGTSAPETAVSVGSAVSGQADIAVGNVVGSNIFNVLFVLGVAALIAPLVVHSQLIRQEVPIMIGASVLLLVLAQDGRIGRVEAGILLALLVAYTVFLVVQSRRQAVAAADDAPAAEPAAGWDRHWAVQLGLIVGGLALLVLGADWLVTAAVAAARAFGISELIIGLTIVAAGTSLPEVAASLAATLKGERDIAVGNVVGSNTFNILGCLGLAGLVAPQGLPVAPAVLNFDGWVMLAVAVAALPAFLTGRCVARWEGLLFLFYYAAYVAYLILAAQHHDALPFFSAAMLWFVLPLTAVTLAVSLLPFGRAKR
ncbi:MAG: calcium/sodium antiporter [Betaproteobacteria bacterium]